MIIKPVLLCTLMYSITLFAQQRKAFVNPQSQCRVKCLNGGFCAYLVDNPSVHTCLCLLNLFYGDRCQYAMVATTTSVPTTMESNSGEGLEKRQRYELPLFDHEELPDDQTTTYDISPSEQMETHQDKEAKMIASTGEMKKEEEDYTEGWDTGDDDEYAYDQTGPSGSVKSESTESGWLQDLNGFTVGDTTGQEHSQRIYSSRKNTDRAVANVAKNSRTKSNEEMLVQRTLESNNQRSQELIPESESEDDGWMMSKRRRVITNGTRSPPFFPTFFIGFFVMPLVRWL